MSDLENPLQGSLRFSTCNASFTQFDILDLFMLERTNSMRVKVQLHQSYLKYKRWPQVLAATLKNACRLCKWEACNLQSGWWMSWLTVHDVGWEGTLRSCDGERENQLVLFSGLVGVKRK